MDDSLVAVNREFSWGEGVFDLLELFGKFSLFVRICLPQALVGLSVAKAKQVEVLSDGVGMGLISEGLLDVRGYGFLAPYAPLETDFSGMMADCFFELAELLIGQCPAGMTFPTGSSSPPVHTG